MMKLTYRELWDPRTIRGAAGALATQIPYGCNGGHILTPFGTARKGMTTEGMGFTGVATSNMVVAAAAAQNAKAAIHITRRFKLNTTFAAGSTSMYLFNKAVDVDNYMRIRLNGADGKLYWEGKAGAAIFSLTSTTVSWVAGTQYTTTVSSDDVPVQRLLVNGVVEDTDTAGAVVTPNGGDMIFNSSSDGGTDGFIGTESWAVIGVGATATVGLTTTDETNLYNGMPPPTAKVQYLYLFDEGRGVTVYDRSGTGGNGTLDSACTWLFGTVRQPCLSLEGINSYAKTATVVSLAGDLVIMLVMRAKSTFVSSKYMFRAYIDANNSIHLYWENGTLWLSVEGSGVTTNRSLTVDTVINEFWILTGRITAAGVVSLFKNGTLVSSGTAGIMSSSLTAIWLGAYSAPPHFDVTEYLHVAVINGALTDAQVKEESKKLNDYMGLGLTI